jgi:hypothetical protein
MNNYSLKYDFLYNIIYSSMVANDHSLSFSRRKCVLKTIAYPTIVLKKRSYNSIKGLKTTLNNEIKN